MSAPTFFRQWEGQSRINIVISVVVPSFLAFVFGFMMFLAGLASPVSVWLVLIGLVMAAVGAYGLWASYGLLHKPGK